MCMGTHCYILGGSELLLLGDHLPRELSEYVKLSGSNCLDICNNGKNGNPPFVMIDDELVEEATVRKVIKMLKRKIGKGENE